MNKKAMYNLTYGLFILTAKDGDKDNGCIVNTVIQVTTSPNRILVAVNKGNLTYQYYLSRQIFPLSNIGDSKVGQRLTKRLVSLMNVQPTRSSILLTRQMLISALKSSQLPTLEATPCFLQM